MMINLNIEKNKSVSIFLTMVKDQLILSLLKGLSSLVQGYILDRLHQVILLMVYLSFYCQMMRGLTFLGKILFLS